MAVTFREVQPVLAYAAAHREDDISLAVLARRARMSPFYLHRTFAAIAGETPKKLTLRLRLEAAAALLLTTDNSVLDIALSCGFQSHETFSRAFLRRFRITPRAYRKRGLVNNGPRSEARVHAALVNAIGPCVGLYGMNDMNVEERMPYVVEKKELAPQPVLLARRRVRRSEIAATIAQVLPQVFLFAQQHGIPLAGLPFTRYVEMNFGLVTLEPGMRIAAPGKDPVRIDPAWTQAASDVGVVPDTLPGGFAVTTRHAGPYDTLPDAYAAIQEWMEAEGLVASEAPWESYVTDPSEHPDPNDWKTDVFWPVASGTHAGQTVSPAT